MKLLIIILLFTGYDNQPTFSADGKSILYVCIDSTKQADIYQYNISKKLSINLTKSEVSEYSPTIINNGLGFTCVVVLATAGLGLTTAGLGLALLTGFV